MKHADDERDSSIERMLAKALRASATPRASDECLDAETIAAWADDALSARERAAARAHAADCDRCQALLAVTIKSMPPVPARSQWRVPLAGWLVPLTVAAAAVAIWLNVGIRTSRNSGSVGRSRAEVAAPDVTAASPAQDASAAARATQPAQPQAGAPQTARQKASPRTFIDALEKREAAPVVAPSSAPGAAAADSRAAEPAPVPAPPSASPSPPAVAENVTIAGGVAGGVPPAQQRDASKTAAPMAPRALGAPAVPGTIMQSFAAREPVTIVSPDSDHRWRLVDARGALQHSSDRGATWETLLIGADVSTGASPSSSICWLAGRGGVVLLSTDGRTFTRLQFPETIDLTSIRATDDRNATVTTRDGRSFSTSDRGVTWAPR